jgi:hypothetical protein
MIKILKLTLYFFPVIVLTLFSLNSCEKYFEDEPVSVFTPENVFSTVDYTETAILGIYQLMTLDEAYTKRVSMYYGLDTDIEFISGLEPDNERRGIAKYIATAGNLEIEKPFVNFYKGIERCNICIARIPQSPVYDSGDEEAINAMDRMLGEALTLRALFYSELIRNWGDVPFRASSAETEEDFNLPKTDRDIIYDQLIDDLNQAAELIPWRSELTADERITKGAAKGLLARIALARGGYSLRKTGGMQRGDNHLQFYQIARDAAYDVIQSGEHRLNPSFEDVFRTHCRYQIDTQYGESMWEVGFGVGESSEVGYFIGNASDDASSYGRAIGNVLANPAYYYSFDENDTRRDVTIALYRVGAATPSGVYEGAPSNHQILGNARNIYIAKWRREWFEPIYPGSNKYTGVNWPILRYSDVLLMFAEAENELNGPTAEAVDAFKQVRERAFAGNEAGMPPIPNSKEGFFNELVKERAWEFGGESIRKYDLIRWNLLGEKLNEMRAELKKMEEARPPYENLPERIIWRNSSDGKLDFYNFDFHIDSATVADRDLDEWPYESDWRIAINDEFIESIAKHFESNSKELLPIHQTIIDQNPNLENDFGY